MKLDGKKVLLTGAAGGLGKEVKQILIERGARVQGIDINQAGDAQIIVADLSDPESAVQAVNEAVKNLGGLDIVINNAGTLELQDAGIKPTTASIASLNTNLFGAWHVVAAALPELLKSNGKIINVSSLFAMVNAPLIPSYSASKRALAAYSDCLRMQYGNQIQVTTVYPGFINTPIHKDAVRQGLSVESLVTIKLFGIKIFSMEESIQSASKGIVKACRKNYRDVGTTFLSSQSLWFARHMPKLVDWFIQLRINMLSKSGELKIALDEPQYD